MPLPANPKPPSKEERVRQKAEKKVWDEANLLRPFAKPYPFEGKQEGYRVLFPGKPTVPQFRDIMDAGTTWFYDEERLGTVSFMVIWDPRDKRQAPGVRPRTDRDELDWHKHWFLEDIENRTNSQDPRWFQRQRYFMFRDQYEAAEVNTLFHFASDDDYFGPQLCRRWFIVTEDDVYRVHVEGNAEVVSSQLADDFFNSFELRPKVRAAR